MTAREIGRLRLRKAPGAAARGVLSGGGLVALAALGRSGLSRAKREGDGATPIGVFGLIAAYYRPDRLRRPQAGLPLTALTPAMGWCDDPDDRNYNRPVGLPSPAHHERLWRDDHLYDVIVVLDFNLNPVRPGSGSAIFLHVARPDLASTEGCVAIPLAAMLRLLPRIGPGTVIEIG